MRSTTSINVQISLWPLLGSRQKDENTYQLVPQIGILETMTYPYFPYEDVIT